MGIFKQGTIEVPVPLSPSPKVEVSKDGKAAVTDSTGTNSISSVANPLPDQALPGLPSQAQTPAERIADLFVKQARLDVGQRETDGKNRSPMIDSVNKALGLPMGEPYCTSALCVRVIGAVCRNENLKAPFPWTGSSQKFFSQAPPQFSGKPGKRGDVGILRLKSDHEHGHAFLLTENEGADGICKTIEYNTDPAGSRDGEGVYESSRNVSDAHMSTSSFEFRGFVHVPEWVTMDVAPPVPPPVGSIAGLAWEQAHPERKEWSDRLVMMVSQWMPSLELAQDVRTILGPDYDSLSRSDRIRRWAQLFVAISSVESSWNPKSVYHEPAPLNSDSIGLFQLSYGDEKNYKIKMTLDPKAKDLEDPLKNIDLAVAIFASLLIRDRVITSVSNTGAARYWSSLRPSRKLSEVEALYKKYV